MGVSKKSVKAKMPVGKLKEPESFDDFLETLDDSSEEEEESEDDEEPPPPISNGKLKQKQNGKLRKGEEDESDEEEEEDSDEEDIEEEEEISGGDDNEEEDEDDEEMEIEEETPKGKKKQEKGERRDDDDSESEGDEDKDPEQAAAEHKKALQRLQDMDPDFFEYLKENDAELLNFEESDGEGSESEDEEKLHRPPDELEEASDSEAEEERVDTKAKGHQSKVEKLLAKGVVNIEVIKDWEEKLVAGRDIALFGKVVEAFECAVHHILEDEGAEGMKWKVEGSANFNALVRLCIKNVKSFCVRYLCGSNNLGLSEQKFDQRPLEFKEKQKWNKLRSKLRNYMNTLVKFLKSMGNGEAVTAVLQHCQKMSGFWALLGSKSYKLLRTLINIWSTGEDTCRIVAFLTIIRMTNYNREVFLTRIYKQMYMAYVANSKFTSANTWPALNLMRSSLTEVYLLDTNAAYSIAFPFIRQLAIHLRNAMTAGTSQNSQTNQNKKEASRIVYSWQFVHSLHLWADVLAHSQSSNDLKLLIYPVIQICLGVIKLVPTKKFIPLRFLVIRMLIKLQEKTGVFIPILPLITEVLMMTDFSPKSISKFSVRPLDMTCCLKADASESGYARSVSDNVFELILRTCKAVATDLSFPEIVTPTLIQLRAFLKKKCKNPEVYKKYRTLIEKIDANSKYISDKRNKALEAGNFSLADVESHKVLRVQMETSKPHPPMLDVATEYLKANARTQAKLRRVNVETRDEKNIPKPGTSAKTKSKSLPSKSTDQLLDSDDDDDGSESEFTTKLDAVPEVEEAPVKAAKRKKKKQKNLEKVDPKKKAKRQKMKPEVEADDELVDLDLSD